MLKSLKEASEIATAIFQKNKANKWVKWFHEGIPDEPKEDRDAIRYDALKMNHCLNCTVISGCYFVNTDLTCPPYPLHPNCHCQLFDCTPPNAIADCSINKFVGYVFSDEYLNNGKRKFFTSMGFTIKDSQFLKSELERQARNRYLAGEYKLGGLSDKGQKMTIMIVLNNTAIGTVMFKSGWMIRPNGLITCDTPFTGKIKNGKI